MGESRAAWMGQDKFGMMVHWIAPGPPPQHGARITDVNAAVEHFDLDRFMDGFRQSKADWLIFTVGQNTGFYASPNGVFERLAGPGHCSERDLALEIAQAVKAHGAKFIVYLPCEIRNQSAAIKEAFGWKSAEGTAQDEFQQRYTDFIAEYAVRFGDLIDGWWFDGAYAEPTFDNSTMKPALWLGAARAGNPNAAVAFNDASFCDGRSLPVMTGQDYLAGEVEFLINGQIRYGRGTDLLTPAQHAPQPPPDCLWHALIPIDCMWGHGGVVADWQNAPFEWVAAEPGKMEKPLYSVDDLERVVRDFKAVGGGVTFNVGIFQEGHLGSDTVDQLAQLARRIGR